MSYHFWQRKITKNVFATLGVTTRSVKFMARTSCGAFSALFWENTTQYKFFISPNENIFPLLFDIKMNFKSRERLEQSGIRFFDELRLNKLIALSCCRSDERRELGINFLTEIKTKFKMKLKSDLTFLARARIRWQMEPICHLVKKITNNELCKVWFRQLFLPPVLFVTPIDA